MAIDEAVAEAVGESIAPPTMRLYAWEPSAVSIGRFQRLLDEVDVAECTRQGVDVVRRRSGGGAVYHGTMDIFALVYYQIPLQNAFKNYFKP